MINVTWDFLDADQASARHYSSSSEIPTALRFSPTPVILSWLVFALLSMTLVLYSHLYQKKRLYTNGRIEDFQIGGAFPSRLGAVSDVIIASDSMLKATRATGKLILGQLKSVQTVDS